MSALEKYRDTAIRHTGLHSRKIVACACQKGSLLIGLIVTMVIMASLGAGMVYLTTTSTFQELFANNHARAYYAAESGGRYVQAVIRNAFASSNYLTDSGYQSLATNTAYTFGENTQFQITNLTVSSSTTKQVDFDVIGIVNEGSFLQARRKISYRIIPANQSGGNPTSTSGPTGPLDLSTPGLLIPKTGGVDALTPASGGLSVFVNLDEGLTNKSVTLSNDALSYPGDFLMQIKLSAGSTNSWLMGLRFNMDTTYQYGYWLTLTNAGSGAGFQGNDVIPTVRRNLPTLLLWQNTPESGYKWIAWADIQSTSVMNGGLTNPSNKWRLGEDVDNYPTLVVRVQRVTTGGVPTNVIRAYIAGPNNQGSPDSIPNNLSKRGYPKWTSLTNAAASEIKWPSPSLIGTWGTWSATSSADHYAGDYFTIAGQPSSGSLVQWFINPDTDVSGSSKTTLTPDTQTVTGTTINDAVITSKFLTGSAYRLAGLFVDLQSSDTCNFYNWGIEATNGSIAGQDGSGSVIQY